MRDVSSTARVVSDMAGTAVLTIAGPHRTFTRWNLTSVVVASTDDPLTVALPTAKVYRSVIAPSSLLGTSRAADAVTFQSNADYLQPGDQLLVVVEGTDPGTAVVVNMFAKEVEL